jgi:hypothetical protein
LNRAVTDDNANLGGARGDYLHALLIIPATTTPGAFSIKDGANTAINVFPGGTLADLKPHYVTINARSTNGGWQITTGASVSVVAVGDFT